MTEKGERRKKERKLGLHCFAEWKDRGPICKKFMHVTEINSRSKQSHSTLLILTFLIDYCILWFLWGREEGIKG